MHSWQNKQYSLSSFSSFSRTSRASRTSIVIKKAGLNQPAFFYDDQMLTPLEPCL